jgi:hypothetical protein
MQKGIILFACLALILAAGCVSSTDDSAAIAPAPTATVTATPVPVATTQAPGCHYSATAGTYVCITTATTTPAPASSEGQSAATTLQPLASAFHSSGTSEISIPFTVQAAGEINVKIACTDMCTASITPALSGSGPGWLQEYGANHQYLTQIFQGLTRGENTNTQTIQVGTGSYTLVLSGSKGTDLTADISNT